jgi:hypothetical protein
MKKINIISTLIIVLLIIVSISLYLNTKAKLTIATDASIDYKNGIDTLEGKTILGLRSLNDKYKNTLYFIIPKTSCGSCVGVALNMWVNDYAKK